MPFFQPSTSVYTIDGLGNINGTGTPYTVSPSGDNNIALGIDALPALTSGDDNIALGNESMFLLQTGIRNIGIGLRTLETLNGGSRNIALGSTAGSGLTTGDDNIIMGNAAGNGTITGDDNIIMGAFSGQSLTNGNQNIIMGNSAMPFAVLSSSNICLGAGALNSCVNVSGVLAIGANAGKTSVGNENVFLGHDSAPVFDTGIHNIFLGVDAGQLITDGSNNTFLGFNTTTSDPTISNSAAIGAGAVITKDNQIVIGTAAEEVNIPGTLVIGGLPLTAAAYGILSVQAGSTAQGSITGTPAIITAWNTNGLSSGVTVDHTDDSLKALAANTYKVDASISFSGSINSTFRIELFVFDDSLGTWSASGFALERKIGSGGDIGDGTLHGIVALDVDDKIALRISSPDGGVTVTLTEAQLTIELA